MNEKKLDLLARLCANQKKRSDVDVDGELAIYLRPLLRDEELTDADAMRREDVRWKVDVPGLGVTYYGRTPKRTLRYALERIVRDLVDGDYDERLAPAPTIEETAREGLREALAPVAKTLAAAASVGAMTELLKSSCRRCGAPIKQGFETYCQACILEPNRDPARSDHYVRLMEIADRALEKVRELEKRIEGFVTAFKTWKKGEGVGVEQADAIIRLVGPLGERLCVCGHEKRFHSVSSDGSRCTHGSCLSEGRDQHTFSEAERSAC